MKLKKIINCFLFSILLLNSIQANNLSPDDTLHIHPVAKKPKPYPQQPIIIKTNPASILWGPIVLTSEYRIVVEMPSSKNQSMQFGISYLGKSPLWSIIENKSKSGYHPIHFVFSGISIQIANKFYLVKKKYGSPFGFYLCPQVVYSNVHIALSKSRAYRKTYIDATQFSANLLVGLQVGRRKRFTTDIYAGLGYKKNTWVYHINTYNWVPYKTKDFGGFFNSNLKITFGVNFGWAIY